MGVRKFVICTKNKQIKKGLIIIYVKTIPFCMSKKSFVKEIICVNKKKTLNKIIFSWLMVNVNGRSQIC